MIELAYRIAPGATYFFASGAAGPNATISSIQTCANAVAALQAAKCDIIIDDLGFGVAEGFYQVGTVLDNAITTAVNAGVQYFSAAGNDGKTYYEGGFNGVSTTIAGVGTGAVIANDFGGGSPYLNLTIAAGAKGSGSFEWAQPFASIGTSGKSATNSLAIYLLDSTGAVVASSTDNQVGLDPVQSISYTNPAAATSTAFRLVVVQNGGTVPAGQLFKLLSPNGTLITVGPNASTGSGNIYGHELLTNQNSLAAINFTKTPAFGVSPPTPAGFTSPGPGSLLFDNQGNALATPINPNEPNFGAAQGSGTAVAGFAPFNGTSAAAPNAGAVLALVLDASGKLSTTQGTSILTQSAIPVTTSLPDIGAGLIQARAAVEIGAATTGARWNTASSGNWANGFTWSTNAAPTSAQGASVDDNLGSFTGNYTITVNTTGNVAGSLAIATPKGSSATVQLAAGGALSIGGSNAANVTAGDLLVAGNGVLNLAGGTLSVAGSLNVNNGTLTFTQGSATANNYAENSGLLTIGGGGGVAGLTLTGTGFAQTGGTATITAQGSLTTTTLTDSAATLATLAGGNVTVNGTAGFTSKAIFNDNGAFTATGALNFNQATITDGGSLNAASALFTQSSLTATGTLATTGALNFNVATVIDGGSFNAGSALFTQSTLTETGTLVTTAALNFDDSGASLASGGAITAGSLGVGASLVGFANTLAIAGRVNDLGALSRGASAASGTITLASTGELDVGGFYTGVGVTFGGNGLLVFTSANTTLLANQLNGVISGLATDIGRIDFTGLTYSAGYTYSYVASNGQVDINDASNTNVATVYLNKATNYTNLLRVQSNGATNKVQLVVACFAETTRIATASGDRAVEQLAVGDIVLTTEGPQRIVWIGSRRIHLAGHPHPERVRPIRFAVGSLGDGLPRRPLLLSPDHALWIDGHLIAARQLVNGASVAMQDVSDVHYFHVELERHAILFAEGAAAESYLDTGNRTQFEGAVTSLHADFARTDHPLAFAPLTTCAEIVEPIWSRLAALANARLPVPAQRAGLTLILANGAELHPDWIDADGRHVFHMHGQATGGIARLRSGKATPAEAQPWLDDRRQLGVVVSEITIWPNTTAALPIPLDTLADGWWNLETGPTGSRRWTDGDAALPLPPGCLRVEVLTGTAPREICQAA